MSHYLRADDAFDIAITAAKMRLGTAVLLPKRPTDAIHSRRRQRGSTGAVVLAEKQQASLTSRYRPLGFGPLCTLYQLQGQGQMLRIGDLARDTGTKVETIRFYERIGMLPPPARTAANYRSYKPAHLQRLNFIRHARSLGFELAEVRSLLDLVDQPTRDCAEADRIASTHLASVESRIERLTLMRDELARMVGICRGGQVASCRVLEVLADHSLCESHSFPGD